MTRFAALLPLCLAIACISPHQQESALASTASFTPDFDPGELNPDAPPETAILGQLAGIWDVEQEVRNQDGSWRATGTAEWRWYFILDGHAIQDDWIKPAAAESGDAKPSFGTNLRIYNADTASWEMAWIDSNNRNLASFTAVNVDDTVVMTGQNPTGRQVRNTFFDMEAETFEWVQEWTFDEGSTWVPVARIHARRRRG